MGPRAISRACNEMLLLAEPTSAQPSWGSAVRRGCTRTSTTTLKSGARAAAVREARVVGLPVVKSGTMKVTDRADEDLLFIMDVGWIRLVASWS